MRRRASRMAAALLAVFVAGCSVPAPSDPAPSASVWAPSLPVPPTDAAAVTAPTSTADPSPAAETEHAMRLSLAVNGQSLTATLVDNSSTRALLDLLGSGPLTLDMDDYGGFEKVGPLGTTLPRNDEPTTTGPGDLILYQGGAFVIYYAPNSWDFTRLGRIDDLTGDELIGLLGPGPATVTLSLPD
ncbi:MAG: hypothetical protein LBC97_08900 [Bifidobacteriaceae bacterium]|nr:hypothetical protein [Bifidobacteriaceae bacterium]